MENNKIINFHIYRYHLLPIDHKNKQIELFPYEKEFSYDDIKKKKNDFFKQVLDNIVEVTNNTYPLKLEHHQSDFFLFKIAQKKTTRITKNFQNKIIDNEPYVYIIINNDKDVQKIAISDNVEAFSNPTVVRNILKKLFNKELLKFGLNIEIEQLFDSKGFWEVVNKYNDLITFISFQFVKPNLANISNSLPEVFKDFSDNVNSHESQISIKAPERGKLDNIDKQNEAINGLVNYTSEGAGSIKMKIKGFRKQIDTKENPVILQIRELDMEGSSEQVLKLYQAIVQE
ncbi:hypothetical protein SAMN05216357_1104 [Porphyromonadaceae bacterium KH3CP3RA]|nr:hypothetical protein SAMN05216357_1104 [Porphyromonadaceae bacterium KH3CP3RA]